MKRMSYFKSISVLLFSAVLLTSCQEKENIPVADIQFKETEITLQVGQTLQLDVTVLPADATDKSLRWASSASYILDVDDAGNITAVKTGKSIVTATANDGDVKATCTVYVVEKQIPVESLSLNETELELEEGTFFELSVKILPENATERTVVWTSSDTKTVSVNNGVIKAKSEGDAIITVRTEDGSKEATCNVRVTEKQIPVESVAFTNSNITVKEGDKGIFSIIILPEDATNRNVTFSTSDEKVVTVEADGSYSALMPGEAVITVTTEDGGKTASCHVRVVKDVVDYIDEYGINHGQGISIDGVIWAPVNCGYHADNFKFGKLYQWGRPFGQPYFKNGDAGSDSGITQEDYDASVIEGPVVHAEGVAEENKDLFYTALESPFDWCSDRQYDYWEEESDPCPEGWRLPTAEEMESMMLNRSAWTEVDGMYGFWFSGSAKYSDALEARIFLPAAGFRMNTGKYTGMRNQKGNYWTSTGADNDMSMYIQFASPNTVSKYSNRRASGLSVRCVCK